MSQICFNGTYFNEHEPVLTADNRGYRYGDGFFETMRVWNSKIVLAEYHKKRIERSTRLLQYTAPADVSGEALFEKAIALCAKNGCSHSARVRLSFSNGNGGLLNKENQLNYLIEAWPLPAASYTFNEQGLITGIFQAIKKSCDEYANIKSASALTYSIATRFAQQQKWDDCLILNQYGHICETSIANIFWTKGEKVFTPPLEEGCVAGVMRAYLTDEINTVTEVPCTLKDLSEADEVFLTNAIKGINWVKNIDHHVYSGSFIRKLFEKHVARLLQTL